MTYAQKISKPILRSNLSKQVARVLVEGRHQVKLSQSKLAQQMNTSKASISRLESGRILPDVHSIDSYARACGLEMHLVLIYPNQSIMVG
jgi:ribosome-binding protein aMBF1 (putative translation factor)